MMKRSIFLVLLALFCLTQISAKPWIAKISPSQGSKTGGTQITIEGDGFSKNKFTTTKNLNPNYGNWVYIRTRDKTTQTFTCEIEDTASNTEKLVCITPNFSKLYNKPLDGASRAPLKWPFHRMHLFVVSDGELSNFKEFDSRDPKTSDKQYVNNPYGYPDRELSVWGSLHTNAYNESIINWSDPSPLCQDRCRIIQFKNGEDVCDIYKTDPINPGKKVIRHYKLDNDGKTTTRGQFKCKLGGNNIGYQNITWKITGEYGNSRSRWHNIIGTDGHVHDFVNFARIESLSSHVVGSLGGSILTIKGNYFLTKEPEKNLKVLIAGKTCKVLSVSMTEITCKVPSSKGVNIPSNHASDDEKYYPGHRGIIWYTFPKEYLNLDQLEAKNMDFLANPDAYPSSPFKDNIPVHNGVRYWNYKKKGYSSFAPFFFNPLLKAKYDLSRTYAKTWRQENLEYDFFENSKFPTQDDGEISRENPFLIKWSVSEPGDDGSTYPSRQWYSHFKLRQYKPVVENILDKGIHQGVSVKSVLNFKFAGEFQSERQKITFYGSEVRNLLSTSNIGVKIGHERIMQDSVTPIDWTNNPMPSISSLISKHQGKRCPAKFTATNPYYFQTFEDNKSCQPLSTITSSFCGQRSLKIPTFNQKWFSIFKEGETKQTCDELGDEPPLQSFPMNKNSITNQWLCFGYKGELAQVGRDVGSYVHATYSYINSTGQRAIMENVGMYSTRLNLDEDKKDDWKWACLDLYKSFRWMNDHYNRNGHEFGEDKGSQHRIIELKLRLNENLNSYVYLDHVTISSDEPIATKEHLPEIIESAGPIIQEVNYETISETDSESTYDLEMVPGACQTGHKLVGLYGPDLEEEIINENTVSYRKSTWPQNNYIQIERTQPSSSSLKGSAKLKFENMETSVKIDVSTVETADIVNAFASAGFETSVSFPTLPTCDLLNFDVEFTRPGGDINLEERNIEGVEHLTTNVTKITQGYEEFTPDMSWFITAHKKPQVQVIINDQYSLCSNNCDFEYSDSMNPIITEVTPKENLIPGQSEITIIGSNILDLVVTSPKCTIIEKLRFNYSDSATDEIKCRLDNDVVSGKNVKFEAFDVINGQPNADHISPLEIDFLTTKVVPEKMVIGGGYAELFGYGLSCDNKINLCRSSKACHGADRIDCVIDADEVCTNTLQNQGQGNEPSKIRFFCKSLLGELGKWIIFVDDKVTTGHLKIEFSEGPRVLHISDQNDQIYSTTFKTTVSGKEEIWLASSDQGFGDDPSKVDVFLDGNLIERNNGDDDDFDRNSMKLTLPVLPTGVYDFIIKIDGIGYVYVPQKIVVDFEITSMSLIEGSMYGGNPLLITGVGFEQTNIELESKSESADDRPLLSIKFGPNPAKDIKFLSNTTISCQVPSSEITHKVLVKMDEQNQINWENNINIFVGDRINWSWNLETFLFDLTMRICEVSSPGALRCLKHGFTSGDKSKQGTYTRKFNKAGTFYVTTDCMGLNCGKMMISTILVTERPSIIEVDFNLSIAGIEQSSETYRKWTYVSAKTGIVFSTNAGQDGQGLFVTDPVKFRGQNFIGSSMTTSLRSLSLSKGWIIHIGETPCDIVSVDDQEISCIMDNSFQIRLLENLKITLKNEHGQAGILTETELGEYVAFKPVVTNIISRNSGSEKGGSKLQLSGYGLDTLDSRVLFDDLYECKILQQSYFVLTCETPELSDRLKLPRRSKRSVGPLNADFADPSYNIHIFSPNSGIFKNLIVDPNFHYKKSETPIIKSVSVSGGNTYTSGFLPQNDDIIRKGSELSFQITGTSENGQITAFLNDVECQITEKSVSVYSSNLDDNVPSFVFKCKVTDALAQGPVSLKINDSQFGDADLDDNMELRLVSESYLTSVTPKKGSVYGGQQISLIGSGFTEKSIVTINGRKCEIQKRSRTEVICITPMAENIQEDSLALISVQPDFDTSKSNGLQLNYEYSLSATPIVTKLGKNSGVSGEELQLLGENLGVTKHGSHVSLDGVDCQIVSAQDTTLTCVLGKKSGGPISDISIHISQYGHGKINENIEFSYDLEITSVSIDRVSSAGGLVIDLIGKGFSDKNLSIELCDREIDQQDVTFIDSSLVQFLLPPSENNSDQICEMKISQTEPDAEAIYRYLRYDSKLMPKITSVSPNRGGTAGGTEITITGSGFRSLPSNFQVKISNSTCEDIRIDSDSLLSCYTGALPIGSNQRARIEIISDLGSAEIEPENESATTFWFIDRWNSRFTWGGKEPPQEGEMVVISAGQNIMIDGSTEIVKMLLVNGGHVIFDETQDCHLRVENILVTNGGSITTGSEQKPYEKSLIIEMFGKPGDLELPVYGAKTLAVREGLLSLHGIKKYPTWTLLSRTAKVNDTSIILETSVNWNIGDEIMIVSTGGKDSLNENEVRTITSLGNNNQEIFFNQPLNHEHLGHIETFQNGKTLDMRAEVGVLTRNIVFKGDDTSIVDNFGGCIMIGPTQPGTKEEPSKGNIQLSNIEVKNAGQIFRLARYPIHMHFLGHVDSDQSFIKDVSVHHTNNRAIVIHHTHNLLVDNSVVYDVKGGAIFIEDGIERFNIVTNNLVSGVKASSSLQLDDLTPAAIWVTNPNNIINNNRIGGCEHFGIWYRMHKHPEAGSFTNEVCQQHEPFGECNNNIVHSSGGIGLWFFETYAPYEGSGQRESCRLEIPKAAKINNFQAYRVEQGIEFFDVGALQVHDSVVAECTQAGVQYKRLIDVGWDNEEKGAYLNNLTIAGRTSKYLEGEILEENGLILPAQSGLLVNKVDFISYGKIPKGNPVKNPSGWDSRTQPSTAIGGTEIQCLHNQNNGAFESRFQNIGWYDTSVKAHSRWANDIQIRDLDGSFSDTGSPGAIIVSDNMQAPGFYDELGCNEQIANTTNFGEGLTICPQSLDFNHLRLMNFWQKEYISESVNIKIKDHTETIEVPFASDFINNDKRGWTINIPTNTEIEIEKIGEFNQITEFNSTLSLLDLKVGQWNIITFNRVSEKPDEVAVDGQEKESPVPLTANSKFGDWHYNQETQQMSLMLNNDGTRNWPSKPKPHGSIFNSVGENSEGIRPINIFRKFYFKYCGGKSCIVEEPIIETPPFIEIPDDRPKEAIFSSEMPFGEEVEVEGYGYYRPTDKESSLIIRRDENLLVEAGTWLVLDSDMPVLGNIIVLGVLEISTSIEELRVKNIFVFGGKLTIKSSLSGSRDKPLRLIFEEDPTKDNKQHVFGPGLEFGSKGLACFGICDFKTWGRTYPYTSLAENLSPNDDEIIISNPDHVKDWPNGGKILVTSTSMDSTQIEELTIEKVDGNRILLQEKVKNFHRGIADPPEHLSQIGEVALIEKFVSIEGNEDKINGKGARILVGSVYMPEIHVGKANANYNLQYDGVAYFKDIEFINTGQHGLGYHDIKDDARYAILYKDSIDEDKYNKVERCYFGEGQYSKSVGIIRSNTVQVHRNTFYKAVHGAVEAIDSDGAKISSNLAINSINVANFMSDFLNVTPLLPKDHPYPVVFSSDSSGIAFHDNKVANSVIAGMSYPGFMCSERSYHSNNRIRGAQIGFLYMNQPDNQESCHEIKDLDITHSYLVGALIVNSSKDSKRKYPFGEIQIKDSIIGNSGLTNTLQMVNKESNANLDDPNFHQSEISFQYKDVKLIGQTNNFNCQLDFEGPHHEFKNPVFDEFVKDSVYKTSFSAAYLGISGSAEFFEGETMYKSLFSMMLFNSLRENTIFQEVTFENVGGTNYVCDLAKASYLIAGLHSSEQHGDLIPIFTRKISKINVDENHLTKFQKPYDFMVNEEKCIDLDCNGYTTMLVSDYDGSLVGDSSGPGALLPNPEYIWGVKQKNQKLNYDRVINVAKLDGKGNEIEDLSSFMPNKGRPKKENSCQLKSKMNAHVCNQNSYHYNYVTLSNHDFDTTVRRLAPLSVISNRGPNGTIDIYNSPARDPGTLWGLSSGFYKTTVALGTEAEYYFSATPPQVLRVQMEGSGFDTRWSRNDVHKKFLFKLYNPAPQVLKLGKLPAEQSSLPKPLKFEPIHSLDRKPTLYDDPGSYFHDREEQMIYVILADNKEVYEITVSDQIALSFGMPPIREEDFFAEKLVSNIAAFYGIAEENIRIVTVISERTRRKKRDTDKINSEINDERIIESIRVEITIDETNSNQQTNVHELTNTISEQVQSGNNTQVNNFLQGISKTEPEKAFTAKNIAILTKPTTNEAQRAYTDKTDKLLKDTNTGKVTTEKLLKASQITQISSMKVSKSELKIDCSNGGLATLNPFDVTFCDNFENVSDVNGDWQVDITVPNDHLGSFSGSTNEESKSKFSTGVIGSKATFNQIIVDCDYYRHNTHTIPLNINVKVTKPENFATNENFSQDFTLKIKPLTIKSVNFETKPQEIDCSLGGEMSMFDLDLTFLNENDEKIKVGSSQVPFDFSLVFSSDEESFIGGRGDPYARNNVIVKGDSYVKFTEISVNCTNFKNRTSKTSVKISAIINSPLHLSGHKNYLPAVDYRVSLIPAAGEPWESNWQNKMQMMNNDGSIRLLSDQNYCFKAQVKSRRHNSNIIVSECEYDPISGTLLDIQRFDYDENTGLIKYLYVHEPEKSHKKYNPLQEVCITSKKRLLKLDFCDPNSKTQKWVYDNGHMKIRDAKKDKFCVRLIAYPPGYMKRLPVEEQGKSLYKAHFGPCGYQSFGRIVDGGYADDAESFDLL